MTAIPQDIMAAAKAVVGEFYPDWVFSTDLTTAIARAILAERERAAAAIKKVRDGYADQARFADIDCAVHFREFVRRIDAIQGA